MIDFETFFEIKRLKRKKLSTSQIAIRLNLSFNTIRKYEQLTPKQFKKDRSNPNKWSKPSRCDKYRSDLISAIVEFPELSSAALYRRLEDKYETVDVSPSTLRRYVRILREQIEIPKKPYERQEQN